MGNPQPFSSEPAFEQPALRSARSMEFEAFWRSIPKEGLIPDRAAFRPERARSLLRELLLVEARLDDGALAIRVVGEAFRNRVQSDVAGRNYLDFLHADSRASALRTVGLLFEQPCAMWQISELHYVRGFAETMELTVFPLLPGERDCPWLLAHMVPVQGLVPPMPLANAVVRIQSPTTFTFLDIGAGLPTWTDA